ncbi:MAG: lysophospholipid acyltransferase family protein [Woeseiaceae bacterium]|nr:lysophospholipid acyltransferase family protein [Woeseiaceae bacterium]
MKLLFRLRIEGEPLPDAGPVILAPNHTSVLDPFAVNAAVPARLRHEFYWGGWTGIAFRNALFRGFSKIARVVPINPERAVVSSLAFAAAILEDGSNLTWFPEGERSASGELGKLRPGIGALLEQFSQVTVVPVQIDGAFEAWSLGRRLPRLRRITVTFGRALSVDELEAKGRGDTKRDRILSGLREAMQA